MFENILVVTAVNSPNFRLVLIMEAFLKDQSCYKCNNCADAIRLSCQIHNICTRCLGEHVKVPKNIECPLCRPLNSDSFSSIFDSPDCSTVKVHEALPDVIHCTNCSENLKHADVQYCRNCKKSICFNCSIEHKRDVGSTMHTIMPFFSDKIPNCCEHKEIAKFFCNHKDCKKTICKSCRARKHKDHHIYAIETKFKECQVTVLKLIKSNAKKLHLVSGLLSALNKRKTTIDETNRCLEVELRQRKTCIIDEVNKEFDNQMKILKETHVNLMNDITNEIHAVENIEADLEKMKELSIHYSHELTNYNVFRDYYAFEYVSDQNISNKAHSKQFNTLALDSEFSYLQVPEIVKSLSGKIEIITDETAILKNVGAQNMAYLPSALHEVKCESTKDICYDFLQNAVYVLTNSGRKYFIYQIHIHNDLRRVEVPEISGSCMRVSPLVNNTVLLQCSDRFISLSMISNLCLDVSIPFCHSNNVLALCTSPGREFIYFYCKGWYVCKYDPIKSISVGAPIDLSSENVCMSVSPNLDYIVFSTSGDIHLFSFNQKKMLQTFNSTNDIFYQCASFLSKNFFIAFERHTPSLNIYNAKKNECIRKITHFQDNGIKEINDFGNVNALMGSPPNSVYVGFVYGRFYKIFNVLLY